MVMRVFIGTTGKWSGHRLVKEIKTKFKNKGGGKRKRYYRVTLMDGKVVSVDDLTILEEIEKKS
jgi:hypothetical protein